MFATRARNVCIVGIRAKNRAQRDTSIRLAAVVNAGRLAVTRSASSRALFRARRVRSLARGKHTPCRSSLVAVVY